MKRRIMNESIDKSTIENINLAAWSLLEDSPTKKIYQKEGIQKRLQIFENGSISIKEYHLNGALNGERFIYDEHGKIESVQKYEKDERIS